MKCPRCSTDFEKYSKRCYLCRPCKREYDNSYHKARSDEQRERKQNLQKERYHANRRTLVEYLSSKSCVHCGESDPIVLDFDHIEPDSKYKNISDMMGSCWESILKEINKCQILCANCHRRKTARQQDWYTK